MSQGSNSSGGGGSGNSVRTSAISQAGVHLNLEGSPLVYSNPKHGFDENTMDTIKDFAKMSMKYKTERGIIIDADGNRIGDVRIGGRGEVYNPTTQDTEITGHSHARGKGEEDVLGGTFSVADMRGFAYRDHARSKFAIGPEGMYTITKQKNWDSSGFFDYYDNTHRQRMNERANRMKPYGQALNRGEISYDAYKAINHQDFNRFVVDLHNDLLAGQKKYGYSYGLEEI